MGDCVVLLFVLKVDVLFGVIFAGDTIKWKLGEGSQRRLSGVTNQGQGNWGAWTEDAGASL